MNIFILNRIPYHKIEYHRGLCHNSNSIFYYGNSDINATIPDNIKCTKLTRIENKSVNEGAIEIIQELDIVFDYVISLSEYELDAAASIRESLNIQGPNLKQIEKVRNKVVMKKCVSNYGIKTPQCYLLSDYLQNPFPFEGKVVLKPIDGASSENVNIFDHYSQMLNFVENNPSNIKELASRLYETYEVEEFIEGDIYHIDGLVKDGIIQTIIPSQYIGTCYKYAHGSPMGSFQFSPSTELVEWCSKVLSATELKNGAFHIEAFNSNGKLVFLELANRVGGADVVRTYEYATGIHLPSEELKITIGTYTPLKGGSINNYYGWFVFPGHHYNCSNVVVKTNFSKSLKESFVHLNTLSEKSLLVKHITYQPHEVPVSAILKSSSEDQISKLISEAISCVEIKELINTDSAA